MGFPFVADRRRGDTKRRRGSAKRGKKRCALGPKVLRAPTARVLKSIYPFAETIERLKKDIAAKGIRFFSEIDQTKLAADAGIKLDPSTLLVHSPAQFDRLKRERDEALGQLAATSEVLRVISNSPGELEPVFRTTLKQATRVCDAKVGIVFRYESGRVHAVAWLDVPPAFHDFIVKEGTFTPKPGQLFGRLCESKAVINIIDRATDRNPSPSFRYWRRTIFYRRPDAQRRRAGWRAFHLPH